MDMIVTDPIDRGRVLSCVVGPPTAPLEKGFEIVFDHGLPELPTLDDLKQEHKVLGAYIQVLEMIEKVERETGKPLTVTIPRDVLEKEGIV